MTTEGNQLPSFLRVAGRQKHSIADRNGETFKLEAPTPSTLVYVQNCKGCECELERKVMKVIVEGCTDCIFNINSTLITGMMEVLNCENLTLNMKENGSVSSIMRVWLIMYKRSNIKHVLLNYPISFDVKTLMDRMDHKRTP